AHPLIWEPEDGSVDHIGVLDEGLLDLRRVDVDTATEDEVDATIGEVQVAVVVEPAQVTDGEIVTVPCARGLLRRVVVLELRHTGEARNMDVADVTGREQAAPLVDELETDAGERPGVAPGLGFPFVRRDDGGHSLARAVVLPDG